MKLKALVAALIATSGLLSMSAAQASDGTVTFTGSIVATSCVITGGGNIAVTLPPVDASALNASGKTATPTQFNIAMTGCPATDRNRSPAAASLYRWRAPHRRWCKPAAILQTAP